MPEVGTAPGLAPPTGERLPAPTGLPPTIEPDDTRARRKGLGLGFWIAASWLGLIVLLALLVPYLPLADPDQVRHGPSGSGPTMNNWLGTDEGGRDLLSRTLWGARVSLLIGFASIVVGLLIGGAIGLLAGFVRGPFDRVSMGALNVLLAFPAVVLALLLVTFLGRELQWILLVIGILAIAPIGRLARANTMVWAEREFVTAARALGATQWRIMRQELLPNIVLPMLALALLGMALAIVAEGSLAFLGLSVEGATSTWGKMIVAGSSGATLRTAPQAAFVPITAMFLTVLALNLMGDRVRVFVDVRESVI